MEDGFISVKPLKLGVGNGSVVADIALDGRKSPIHTIADLDFRELDFSQVVDKLPIFRGTGTIGGKATLDMHGNSVAVMLGARAGSLKTFMSGGALSALYVNVVDSGEARVGKEGGSGC